MRNFLLILIGAIILSTPAVIFAEEYTLLAPLGSMDKINMQPGGNSGLSVYLSWFFKFALAAAGILATTQIVIAGVQMIASTASEKARSDAKDRISDAVWGLILALGAYLILNTINPDLVRGTFGIEELRITVESPPEEEELIVGVNTDAISPANGAWGYDQGIRAQIVDASDSLQNLLVCMRPKLSNGAGQISSISDGHIIGNLKACNSDYSSRCQHMFQSCHYGGKSGATKSEAVDFGDERNAAALIRAANECGAGYAANEGNHVHVSTRACPKN